jgi:hypothetical protein
MENKAIEHQIMSYLCLLNKEQTHAVLKLVKTFAASQQHKSFWNDNDFSKEMNARATAYEKGTAKLMKFNEMKIEALQNYYSKKQNRNDQS